MSIRLQGLSKSYRLYQSGWERLWEVMSHRKTHRERQVLEPLSLDIGRGEVVGIVGVNGAGKSTLLKLIAGTLKPTTGSVACSGRVCALLELGAGFHPDMSGRDNIYLGGAVAGQSSEDIGRLYDSIVDFAGLREVIDQPVKTYSSGMLMRLAFSVATAVDPDILILDETLSVGDGMFASKSFERIMGFKKAGKTILFCSHSMYQVEAICSRALWLEKGRLRMDDEPGRVVKAYNNFLLQQEARVAAPSSATEAAAPELGPVRLSGQARISDLRVRSTEGTASPVAMTSGKSDLFIELEFVSDPELPPPSLGVTLLGGNGRPVTSASSRYDGVIFERDESGHGRVRLQFPNLALLRGHYWVNVYLMCDQGLHFYDKAERVAELDVVQEGPELGVVSLPRDWTVGCPVRP